MDVHANTSAVLDVKRGRGIGKGVAEGLLPANRTVELSQMRSAVEADRLARNRSIAVATVPRVDLEVENSTLVYEITHRKPNGTTRDVVVPALRDDGTDQ